MNWLAYMHQEGFTPDPGPPLSTMGRLRIAYRRGDEVYLWGLGEAGHAPSLLTWPKMFIPEQREGNRIIIHMPQQKHVERILKQHGPAAVREAIRTGHTFIIEP